MLNVIQKSAGFTLIEVLIVVTIIGIAMMLGIPSYRTWMQNSQVYNAAESAQSGLQKAKALAISNNTKVEFILTGTSPATWLIQLPGNSLACPMAAGVDLTTLLECSGSEGAKNVSAAVLPSGADTITFSSLGAITTNLDTSASIAQIDFSTAISDRNLRVMIGAGGITRMCDPNLTSGSSPRAC